MKRSILFSSLAAGFCGVLVAVSNTAVSTGQSGALVRLQATTPGAVQTGHANISGTVRSGQLVSSGSWPLNSAVTGTNTSSLTGSSGVEGESTAATGTVYGVSGIVASTSGRAVYGEANATSGTSYAGYFNNDSVLGYGVRATSDGLFGVYGSSSLIDGTGVMGVAKNTGSGSGNYGVYGQTDGFNGVGVFGESLSTSGANFGGRFRNSSTAGVGVSAAATATSGITYGGRFENNSTSGRGIFAYTLATVGTTYGVLASSASDTGYGVFGASTAATGLNFGVRGESDSSSGRGVSGYASNTAGSNYGGHFEAEGSSGRGVFGFASNSTGTNYGGQFTSNGATGRGVYGLATDTAGANFGGYFQTLSTSGDGLRAIASASGGVQNGGVFLAQNAGGVGAIGIGEDIGFLGEAEASSGTGVQGYASSNSTTTTHYGVKGVLASGSDGWGVFSIGAFGASGTKAFRIDHPLDPASKYLLHYSTESPTPQNFYVGNVTTDGKGRAWVELPSYFSAINANFKYQLTVIGDDESETFVQVKVARKIQGNRFLIMSSAPNVEVSWRVDADRNDAWVQANPQKDEIEKLGREKGTYQHPELYGADPGLGMEAQVKVRSEKVKGAPKH